MVPFSRLDIDSNAWGTCAYQSIQLACLAVSGGDVPYFLNRPRYLLIIKLQPVFLNHIVNFVYKSIQIFVQLYILYIIKNSNILCLIINLPEKFLTVIRCSYNNLMNLSLKLQITAAKDLKLEARISKQTQ